MIISHRHKFVLLSPWKAASSTTNETLKEYNESAYNRFFYFNRSLNRVVHQHITLAEFMSLPESKLGYIIGAFVRNPYDRAYSGFLQLQRDIASQPREKYPNEWIRDLVKAQLVENQKRIIESEYDFNKWIIAVPEYEIFEVGRNTNMSLHPSNYWTHINGQKGINFIGRVEQFETDFNSFCGKVGIPSPEIISANVNEAQGASQSVQNYKYVSRMSKTAIARINELFREDFDLLGYEMMV